MNYKIKGLKPLSILNVEINDTFWAPRLQTNREITLNQQFKKLKESGCIENFLKSSKKTTGNFHGKWFGDSDLYKWLEAACYILTKYPDPNIVEKIDYAISIIARAQEDSGYLNTYFTLREPNKKWTNLGIMHELFCAGHLIQAAVAHYEATNKESLLHLALKFADHIDKIFGYQKKIGYPGHEEIELALTDLYRITNNEKYLKLAKFFIDQRGGKNSRFKLELENLDEIAGGKHNKELYRQFFLDKNGKYDGRYAQDHCPIYTQTEVVGHAVRAMYLYCGMSDIAFYTGDEKIVHTLQNLWRNMTEKRMYITGGIGSSHKYEGFTFDYDLPNDRSYSETCAAVGNVMWNFRMLRLTGEAKYADIMERILYNNFLSGVSLDGTRFFYVNPLESDGTHHRQEWFDCACCPPNVLRLFASLERYIYLTGENDIFINLYIDSKVEISLSACIVRLRQESDYPWDGIIKVKVCVDNPCQFNLHLRLPNWCRDAKLYLNDVSMELNSILENGYIRISKVWKNGDQVELRLDMPVERICAHPNTRMDLGTVALQRGPIVYCLEQIDNPFPLDHLILPKNILFDIKFEPNLLNGIMVIEGTALIPDIINWEGFLYRRVQETSLKSIKLKAIPYYAWDNRNAGPMRVWIKYDQF